VGQILGRPATARPREQLLGKRCSTSFRPPPAPTPADSADSEQVFSPVGLASNLLSTDVFPQNITSLSISLAVWFALVGLALLSLHRWDKLQPFFIGLLHPETRHAAPKEKAAESNIEGGDEADTGRDTLTGGKQLAGDGKGDEGVVIAAAAVATTTSLNRTMRVPTPVGSRAAEGGAKGHTAVTSPTAVGRGSRMPWALRFRREKSLTVKAPWPSFTGIMSSRKPHVTEVDLEGGYGPGPNVSARPEAAHLREP